MENTAADPAAPETAFAPDTYAIVEIMGHDRIAGRIAKESFGGAAFLRVDVPNLPAEPPTERAYGGGRTKYVRPATPERPAFTKLFGAAAIFSLRLVSQEEALADELERRERPREEYVYEADAVAALTSSPGEIDARAFLGSDEDDEEDHDQEPEDY